MGDTNTVYDRGVDVAKLSALVLVILSIAKAIVALISGSVALLADSIHSFSDIFSALAVWVGLRLVQRKPNERFPYGYFKAETLALLIVSVIVAASGVLIVIESVEALLEPSAISFPLLGLTIAAISGVVSFGLARYKRQAGNAIGSKALISEGHHSMVDVYTSLLVFIGILSSAFGLLAIEILAGLLIGAYVTKLGFSFGKDAVFVLMDASMSPERLPQIREIAENVPGVKGVHSLRVRKSGPVTFGEMHIELQEKLALDRAHAISSEIEKRIKSRFKDVEGMVIHMEPGVQTQNKIGIPIDTDEGLDSMVSSHFGDAPFLAFVETVKRQPKRVYTEVNDAAKLTKKKGIATARFFTTQKIDTLLTGDLGEGPFYVLSDKLIQVYHLPQSVTIKEAVRLLNQNKLQRMTSPIEIYHKGGQ